MLTWLIYTENCLGPYGTGIGPSCRIETCQTLYKYVYPMMFSYKE